MPVTLRRLLTHRAGFEDHLKGLFSKDREPQPLGRWLAKYLPLRLFPRGDIEAYSNYGFALAGYVVERDFGRTLRPLCAATHSRSTRYAPFHLQPAVTRRSHATDGQGYRTSVAPPLPFFETIVAPAGGLSATAADMGRFVRALMNGGELDGNRILPKARLDEVMAPSHGTPAGYLGLAFHGTKARAMRPWDMAAKP